MATDENLQRSNGPNLVNDLARLNSPTIQSSWNTGYFIPRHLYATLPIIPTGKINMPDTCREKLYDLFIAAFTVAITKNSFARDRKGGDTGFTYKTASSALENIGSTFMLGQIIYQFLNMPYDDVTVYDLMPQERNHIVIDPDTKESIPRHLVSADLLAKVKPITSQYPDGLAEPFIKLYNLPVYRESNFSKMDHDVVRDCINKISNLPLLEGDDEPVVIYNVLVSFVKLACTFWFGNDFDRSLSGSTLSPIKPREEANGFEVSFKTIDLVDLALSKNSDDFESKVFKAFETWLLSIGHEEIIACFREFSKLPFTGDVTIYGNTLPNDFMETFSKAVVDSMATAAINSAVLYQQGPTFFRDYKRASLIMKTASLRPDLAKNINTQIDSSLFFGFCEGSVDMTPSAVNDFLSEFYRNHADIVQLWKLFVNTFYSHSFDRKEFLPVITGLYTVNSHGQKEIYTYTAVAPYDRSAKRIFHYDDGDVLGSNVYSSLETTATRFNQTDREVVAYKSSDSKPYVVDKQSWDINPRLIDLMRSYLKEIEVFNVSDALTSVHVKYSNVVYLLIPKLNMELPYLIDIEAKVSRLPHSWQKFATKVEDLTIPQLAFAFTKSEAASVKTSLTDESLTKLYLDRLNLLASGNVIGSIHYIGIPSVTRAARFQWNSFVATKFPRTAAKCIEKVKVSCKYDDIPPTMKRSSNNVELSIPRDISIAFPVSKVELDSKDLENCKKENSPEFDKNGIVYYDKKGRMKLYTQTQFATFMPDYCVGVTTLRLDEEFFAEVSSTKDKSSPDNINIKYTSPFFKVDTTINKVTVIGDGSDFDFYDPFGVDVSAIMASFLALGGIVCLVATSDLTSFFGPTHPIYKTAASNFLDILEFWSELHPEGTPAQSEGLLIKGNFKTINHQAGSAKAAAKKVLSNLDAAATADFATKVMSFVNQISVENENMYLSKAGFVHHPLYFGSLLALLREKRFGYVRSNQLLLKPVRFNITVTPSMRDEDANKAVASIINSFASVNFLNFAFYNATLDSKES